MYKVVIECYGESGNNVDPWLRYFLAPVIHLNLPF